MDGRCQRAGRRELIFPPSRSYRLFLLSFAVQHALDQPESGVDLPAYCVLCFESASKMIGELEFSSLSAEGPRADFPSPSGIARDFLGPNGILRYAMVSSSSLDLASRGLGLTDSSLSYAPSQDSTFVYLSYSATFLLKLISPTFSHIIEEETAMRLVRDVAETFERSAVDDAHTPALCPSIVSPLSSRAR